MVADMLAVTDWDGVSCGSAASWESLSASWTVTVCGSQPASAWAFGDVRSVSHCAPDSRAAATDSTSVRWGRRTDPADSGRSYCSEQTI